MGPLVVDLEDVGAGDRALVGGKAASLGALLRIPGVEVPPGVCVTTAAFEQVVRPALTGVDLGDARAARAAVEAVDLPADLITALAAKVRDGVPYAVRSSATAEDLPAASFAGQQDSFLGVTGVEDVLAAVRRCWASLFTDRAVAYRAEQGVAPAGVAMAVVVQELVPADAAGVLFTADPVSGDRTVTAVEAVPGLGEALVSGRVTPDRYRVRDGEVEGRGSTLTAAQVRGLAVLGRTIATHLGRPQDVEWCRVGDRFAVVQSRPITTIFPPPPAEDDARRVYLSVGHQQMMTDAMTPLGLSLHQLVAAPVMHEAASRLFVEITPQLGTTAGRTAMVGAMAQHDPLTADALQQLLDRPGFLPPPTDDDPTPMGHRGLPTVPASDEVPDPSIVPELMAETEASIARLEQELAGLEGEEALDAIEADVEELRRLLFAPRSRQTWMAGMDASWWLNEHLEAWLGEKNVADTLALSAPHNVTAEMGLVLLDVADAVRPHPEAIAFLEELGEDDPLDGLAGVAGGPEALAAFQGFLDRYGMRCVGEIDITRPRWSEQPAALVPVVLGNVRTFAPGEAQRRVARGEAAAEAKAKELLARVRELPDGEAKAAETAEMIDRVRAFTGYREFPKFGFIRRYPAYKRALLAAADALVAAGALRRRDDLFFLRFEEVRDAVRAGRVDLGVVDERRAAFAADRKLTPPRVLTSDGESVTGAYRRDDVPEGALAGLPVSVGTVEGRARVLHDMAEAAVEPGDILVTATTDPSWSPLFVAIAGLVTEVGGQMTHGAVVAREYGLPAVVGVERATERIRNGQRIRVDGTNGLVEVLD